MITSLYCSKLQQCVDSVTLCFHRAAGVIPSKSACASCDFISRLLIFHGDVYKKWPYKLTVDSRYVQEAEKQMGVVFDKNGRMVLEGLLVEVPTGEWVIVRKVYPPKGVKTEAKVSVLHDNGDRKRFKLHRIKVVSPAPAWRVGDSVKSVVNPSIEGTITEFWKNKSSVGKWVVVKTVEGPRVEKTTLLVPGT